MPRLGVAAESRQTNPTRQRGPTLQTTVISKRFEALALADASG